MTTMTAVHANEAAAELAAARAITADVQQELQMRRLSRGTAARVLTKAIWHLDEAAGAIESARKLRRGEVQTAPPLGPYTVELTGHHVDNLLRRVSQLEHDVRHGARARAGRFQELLDRVRELEPDDQADEEIRDLIGWRHAHDDEIAGLGGRVAQLERDVTAIGTAAADAAGPVI